MGGAELDPVALTERVRAAFLARTRGRYRQVPSAPLTTHDPTLLFVNASITPFKPAMLRGEPVEATAVIQRCLRTAEENFANGWAPFFHMLGIVGGAEHLPQMTADMVGLLGELELVGQGQLLCALNLDHAPLHAAVKELLPADRLFPLTGNVDKLWTDWHFGHGEELTGRGLTLLWEDLAAPKCSPTCDPHCWCPKYQALGNVIELHHRPSGRRYAEAGFGMEVIASARIGGDVMRAGPIAHALDGLSAVYGPGRATRTLLCYCVGAGALVEAGVEPSNKRHGHVLRRLLRRTLECGAGEGTAAHGYSREALGRTVEVLISAVRAGLGLLFGEPAVDALHERLRVEAQLLAGSVEQGVRHARRLLRANEGKSVEELEQLLCGTFGVPVPVARQLCRDALAA